MTPVATEGAVRVRLGEAALAFGDVFWTFFVGGASTFAGAADEA